MLELLRARLPAIGDDSAVVEGLLLCADACVAGVHADLSLVGVDDLGWKALAASVSDIAAMGGQPVAALVTVSGTVDLALLYDGLLAAAEEFGCPVVGGDLSAGDGLVVSVSVVGRCPDGAEPVWRSGAQAGDTLFVTGGLGASAAGLAMLQSGRGRAARDLVAAHRRPRARLAEGQAARQAGATAMIDLSDGLGIDLWRLADASEVGVVLERAPAFPGASKAQALGGGEDYELLFAAPDRRRVATVFGRAGLRSPLPVGRCTADAGERRFGDGELPRAGWQHDFPVTNTPSAGVS